MSTEQFSVFYDRMIAAYNRGDMEDVMQYFSPDYAHHNSNRPNLQTREQYKEFHKDFLSNFPGAQLTLEEMSTQGTLESGSVFVRLWVHGTGRGSWFGVPVDGKTIDYPCFMNHHLVHGNIIEGWELYDVFKLFTQMGLIPTPVSAAQSNSAPTPA